MEWINNNIIFDYLRINDNDILTNINMSDLDEILYYLDKYYLEYRDNIDVSSYITFGSEIEFENFKGTVYDYWPFQLKINDIIGNDGWQVVNDITLNYGREIVSDILIDEIDTWYKIREVCKLAKQYGIIGSKSSLHIHIGSQIFGNNPIYWYRFFKLWSVYENIIYRFCYGEYLSHRFNICRYARPTAMFFDSRLDVMKERLDGGLNEMLYSIKTNYMSIDSLKYFGISYWHMLADDNYDLFDDFDKINKGCTIECRCSNGTFNEVIIQNTINFLVKMMLYCKSDKFDEDILDRRKRVVYGIYSEILEYSKIYLEQSLELCDMIFDNNLDKIYFLKQYLKSFDFCTTSNVLAKKITL